MKHWSLFLLLVLLPLVPAAADDVLDDPAIREILAMTDAGVGEAVILARLEQLDAWPELTGGQLAALKQRQVSDRVLLRMVELGGRPAVEPAEPSPPAVAAAPAAPSEAPPPPQPPQPPATAAPPAASPTALLRIEFESPFAVTWLEIQIDGKSVAELGELPVGESEPGGILRWPPRLRFADSRTVFEGEVAPGERSVRVSYAVTEVAADLDDEWSEYSRQQYASAGVQAAGERPEGRWTDATAASCTTRVGEVCTVVARASRKAPTAMGGPRIYLLHYQTTTDPAP